MLSLRAHQFAAPQNAQRSLDRTLGQASAFRNVPETAGHRRPSVARCQSIQVQINNECSWVFVVADQVTH
jgi:hypothetical protein